MALQIAIIKTGCLVFEDKGGGKWHSDNRGYYFSLFEEFFVELF